MNERIEQLTRQAKVDVGTLFAEMLCNDSEVNVKIAEAWNSQPQEVRTQIFQTIEQNQKKFAELIVRECIKEIEFQYGGGSDQPMDNEWDRAIECVSSMVKYRFGVEE